MIQALRRKRQFFLAALVKAFPAFIGATFVFASVVKDQWGNRLLVALFCANVLLWLIIVLTNWDRFRRAPVDEGDPKD